MSGRIAPDRDEMGVPSRPGCMLTMAEPLTRSGRIIRSANAGVKVQNVARKAMQVLRPIQLQQGDKRIALYPSHGFKVSYTISFDHPLLRHQQKTMELDEQAFVDEIAPARTFGFLKEVEILRQRGLALGGSFENSIVLGETGVLNPLRFEDEFVRHKILDAVGDLALLGYAIQGHLVVHRGGHALHTAFAREVLRQPDAWKLVDAVVHEHHVADAAPVAVRHAS
jgi:UDP-3-O-[3-hydroxymyristoyl] N-acetylglucosamine deacetylase